MKPAIAALLLAVPQVAGAAAPPPCVTRAEVVDMTLYVFPAILPGVIEKCRATLPAGAWLPSEGPAYIERVAASRDEHWPGARAAFVKIAGEVPDGLSDETLQRMMDEVLRAKLMPEIKVKDCGTIDEFARLLAPLPPENLAQITALVLQMSERDKGRRSDVPVCAAPR